METMFDESTLQMLAKVRWSAADFCQEIELTPEERDASNELSEKILMLADEHFVRTRQTDPALRPRYFIAAIARAMTGVNILAQMHGEGATADKP
jgi:hypothetical protein